MFTTDKAKELTQRLVDRFSTGDIAPIVKLSTIRLTSKNSIPASRWSFSNQFLAIIQTGEFDCRGFRQWQEIGRSVKAGSHACYILGPMVRKENEDGVEKIHITGFKSIPVFPFSMTDGTPLPELENISPKSLPPLADVAEKWGIPVSYVPFTGKAYGAYGIDTKDIRLATHEETVFFHELAHAAHARIEKVRGGQDTRQETIAEFCACVLMGVYGLKDTSGTTWNYIKSYNPDNPLKGVLSVLDTIGKVLDLILLTAES
jgi:hypothetical protein